MAEAECPAQNGSPSSHEKRRIREIGMEHRWGNRVICDIDVTLFAEPASVGQGRIRDISVSGGYIETALPLRPLSTLRIFRTPTRGAISEADTMRAIVVRRDSNGVGVEWFEGDMDAAACLVQEARANRGAVAHLPPAMRTPWIGRQDSF